MANPKYRIPEQIEEAIGQIVKQGLFPTKQAFITFAVGEILRQRYGYGGVEQ